MRLCSIYSFLESEFNKAPHTMSQEQLDSAVPAPPQDIPIEAIPSMMADDFEKTLENSPEWQNMYKSLEEALAKFDTNETKEVVDVPLIKSKLKT